MFFFFLIQINKQFCQMLEAQDMLAAPTMPVCRQLLLGLLRTADEWRDIPVSIIYCYFPVWLLLQLAFFFFINEKGIKISPYACF